MAQPLDSRRISAPRVPKSLAKLVYSCTGPSITVVSSARRVRPSASARFCDTTSVEVSFLASDWMFSMHPPKNGWMASNLFTSF